MTLTLVQVVETPSEEAVQKLLTEHGCSRRAALLALSDLPGTPTRAEIERVVAMHGLDEVNALEHLVLDRELLLDGRVRVVTPDEVLLYGPDGEKR